MKKDKTKLYSGASPAEVAADLAPLVTFTSEGLPLDELKAMITDRLLPHLMQYDLPAFQSMFNAIPSAEGQLGGKIALAFNQGVTNWQVSPGGAMLETLATGALCELFQLGPDADATFMYSGTYANLQGLYLALHHHASNNGFDFSQKGLSGFANPEKLTILVSTDAHFSLKHAVRTLGLGEQCLAAIPVDKNRRMDPSAIETYFASEGMHREVFCIVATSGTTSTGAVDPIAPIAEICRRQNSWLHIDGAYGHAYKLVPEWSHLFAGDELADSISWDPHKQLGAPIPSSVLFTRKRETMANMALFSDYFNRAEDVEPNPGLKSPPSTRHMAALPLVAILRGQGLDRVVAGLRAPLAAIQGLADYLEKQPDFDVLHQPDTGILCFRARPAGVPAEQLGRFQKQLFEEMMRRGKRAISVTNFDGQTALRVVSVSPSIQLSDFIETITALRGLVNELV